MLPKEFKPKASYELIRLGKDNDGGYLVELNSIKQSKSLIAMGMGRDCSFENDFNFLLIVVDIFANSFLSTSKS